MNRLNISDFDYPLTCDRIAKYPLREREESKLLIYSGGNISHTSFKNITDFLPADQLMVFNNTRVIQARLKFRKRSGAQIEIFCLEPSEPADYESAFTKTGSCTWKCLVGNAGKWKNKPLTLLVHDGSQTLLSVERTGRDGDTFLIRFSWIPGDQPFSYILEATGQTPIPPYLEREPEQSDKTHYQTIYSKIDGSVAAPTAGFHFTKYILDKLAARGTRILETTLHIGAGTFRPVLADDVTAHIMHREHFYFTPELLENMMEYEGRITAVGTTSVRTLETIYWLGVKVLEESADINHPLILDQKDACRLPGHYSFSESISRLIRGFKKSRTKRAEGLTQLMILPGYRFHAVNKIITNFHLPRSTLLLLIAAFVGEDWKKIYRYALDNDFRFLSYGDSSLLSTGPNPR
jgi:S-adenosylmethionine:tRNA ribosyltransferase-isomerase